MKNDKKICKELTNHFYYKCHNCGREILSEYTMVAELSGRSERANQKCEALLNKEDKKIYTEVNDLHKFTAVTNEIKCPYCHNTQVWSGFESTLSNIALIAFIIFSIAAIALFYVFLPEKYGMEAAAGGGTTLLYSIYVISNHRKNNKKKLKEIGKTEFQFPVYINAKNKENYSLLFENLTIFKNFKVEDYSPNNKNAKKKEIKQKLLISILTGIVAILFIWLGIGVLSYQFDLPKEGVRTLNIEEPKHSSELTFDELMNSKYYYADNLIPLGYCANLTQNDVEKRRDFIVLFDVKDGRCMTTVEINADSALINEYNDFIENTRTLESNGKFDGYFSTVWSGITLFPDIEEYYNEWRNEYFLPYSSLFEEQIYEMKTITYFDADTYENFFMNHSDVSESRSTSTVIICVILLIAGIVAIAYCGLVIFNYFKKKTANEIVIKKDDTNQILDGSLNVNQKTDYYNIKEDVTKSIIPSVIENYDSYLSCQLVALYCKETNERYKNEFFRRLNEIGFLYEEAEKMFETEKKIIESVPKSYLISHKYIDKKYFNLKAPVFNKPFSFYVERRIFTCSEVTKIWNEAETILKNKEKYENYVIPEVWQEILLISRNGGAELFKGCLKQLSHDSNVSIDKIQKYSVSEFKIIRDYQNNKSVN